MPREDKVGTVERLSERLGRSPSCVLVDYRGLNVAQATALRDRLREAGVDFKVVKNTLTNLAAHEAGIEGLDEFLVGPTAIAFAGDDPVAPARELAKFAREVGILQVKAGLLDGAVIGAERVEYLSKLPGKEELLGQVAGAFAAPLTSVLRVLQAPIRQLVLLTKALHDQRAGMETA